MLNNREVKNENTFKEFIIETLSNLAPQTDIETFAEKLYQSSHKINAELKNTLFIEKRDKLLDFFGSIFQGQSFNEELLKSTLLEFTQQENIQEEKEAELIMTALKQHMESFGELQPAGSLIFDFFEKITHAEITSNENLSVCIAEFLNNEFKNCTETESLAKGIADKFIAEFNEKKNYYKIKDSLALFASEKMYHANKESTAFNLHTFYNQFSQHVEAYVDDIHKKYEPFAESITNHFSSSIELSIPLFEKTLEKFETSSESLESKSNDHVEQFKKYAHETLQFFIRQQVKLRQRANKELAYQIHRKNNALILSALQSQHEVLSDEKEINQAILKVYNEWSELTGLTIPFDQIKDSLVRNIRNDIHNGDLVASMNALALKSNLNQKVVFFKSAIGEFKPGQNIEPIKEAYDSLNSTLTKMEDDEIEPELTASVRETIAPIVQSLRK